MESPALGAISRQPVRDRRPAASDPVRRHPSEPLPLAVHPTAMRAFLSPTPSGPVIVAEPDNTYALPVPPCAQPYFSGLSGDGRRLSYFCGNPRSVMVVDSGDGRLLGTVALGAPTSRGPRPPTCSTARGPRYTRSTSSIAFDGTRCGTDASTSPPASSSPNDRLSRSGPGCGRSTK